MTRSAGFSIVELLVATGLALSALACALTLVRGMQSGFVREGERTDMQQRLRVAVSAIDNALSAAGAGPTRGPRKGPLVLSAPPVLPFRQGAQPDPAGTFTTGTITVLSVPSAASAQTTIRASMAARSGVVPVAFGPGCPPGDAACGFRAGMQVLLLGQSGSYDLFTVTGVQGDSLNLRHDMADSSAIYSAGAAIVEVSSHTFYLKPDPATASSRLMRYDASGPDVAVVDHVVDLSVSYFGEPAPPVMVKAPTDPVGPWTTYGPEPPRAVDQTSTYPAGENCLFRPDGSTGGPVARLPDLGGGSSVTLVSLTAAGLTDGPWCPDAANPNRYDADLFRIRRVDVTLRVQSASAGLRGPAGPLFARAGTSRSAERWLPDVVIRFSVAPRNLSGGR